MQLNEAFFWSLMCFLTPALLNLRVKGASTAGTATTAPTAKASSPAQHQQHPNQQYQQLEQKITNDTKPSSQPIPPPTTPMAAPTRATNPPHQFFIYLSPPVNGSLYFGFMIASLGLGRAENPKM